MGSAFRLLSFRLLVLAFWDDITLWRPIRKLWQPSFCSFIVIIVAHSADQLGSTYEVALDSTTLSTPAGFSSFLTDHTANYSNHSRLPGRLGVSALTTFNRDFAKNRGFLYSPLSHQLWTTFWRWNSPESRLDLGGKSRDASERRPLSFDHSTALRDW